MSHDNDALREAAQAVLNRIDRTVYRDNVGMRAGSDVDPVWAHFRAALATRTGSEADGMGWALRVKDELTRRMLSDTPEARATAAETALAAMTERVKALEEGLHVEFYQQDWIPGFAAFLPGATTPAPDSRAFCVLNLGSILATVHTGDVPATDVPYFIAECMMHEIMHCLEQWAGLEFSEERIEALLEKYRAAAVLTAERGEG